MLNFDEGPNFFRGWLPNMLGEAELIVEEKVLRRAWLTGDASETSVVSPDELLMQTLGVTSEDDWPDLSAPLAGHPSLRKALAQFREELEALAAWMVKERPPVELIFGSRHWSAVKDAAVCLLREATRGGFSSADFDPI